MSEVDRKGKRRGLAEAERRIEEARATGERELDLSGLELAAIPDSLAALTKLKYLHLSGDQIVVIPARWLLSPSWSTLSFSGTKSPPSPAR